MDFYYSSNSSDTGCLKRILGVLIFKNPTSTFEQEKKILRSQYSNISNRKLLSQLKINEVQCTLSAVQSTYAKGEQGHKVIVRVVSQSRFFLYLVKVIPTTFQLFFFQVAHWAFENLTCKAAKFSRFKNPHFYQCVFSFMFSIKS